MVYSSSTSRRADNNRNILCAFIYSFVFLFAFGGTNISFAQPVYRGSSEEIFFGRQPSARVEALGRGAAAFNDDVTATFYNPAGLSSLRGLSVAASYASPYYLLTDAWYNYLGAAYSIDSCIVVALSRYYFTYGVEIERYTYDAKLLGTSEPTTTLYTLSAATNLIQGFSVGVNLNVMDLAQNYTPVLESNIHNHELVYFLDLGLQQRFEFDHTKHLAGQLQLGANLSNLNSSKIEYASVRLPVRFHLGAAYSVRYRSESFLPMREICRLTFVGEYQDLLNSKFYTTTSGGIEVSFLDVIAVRFGYWSQTQDDLGLKVNRSENHSLTLGLGFHLSMKELTQNRIPLSIQFDFTHLNHPGEPYQSYFYKGGKFTVLTLSMNYAM